MSMEPNVTLVFDPGGIKSSEDHPPSRSSRASFSTTSPSPCGTSAWTCLNFSPAPGGGELRQSGMQTEQFFETDHIEMALRAPGGTVAAPHDVVVSGPAMS